MRSLITSSVRKAVAAGVLLMPAVQAFGQSQSFDPRDFSGFWNRAGYQERREGIQIVGGCATCGDNGISTDVPPMTPEGKKRYEANKPAYGRPLGSAPQ